MKKYLIILTTFICCSAATKQPGIRQKNYFYAPAVAVISGTIKVESFFGPPGYGENLKTDRKENSYMIYLDNPINVIAKAEDMEEGVNTTQRNISKIQLISTSGIKIANYKNKSVRLMGTFFGAITGHHHTSVLMDVKKIESLRN